MVVSGAVGGTICQGAGGRCRLRGIISGPRLSETLFATSGSVLNEFLVSVGFSAVLMFTRLVHKIADAT